MWLKAPNISCTHGFSTKHGGVSPAPFQSLNLGGSDDAPENILQNQQLALAALNALPSELCFLKQVHGNSVQLATTGVQEGDALVSNEYGKTLVVSAADCYPILFYDETAGVIGAAHAGWRGTVTKIAANTIKAMEQLGAKPSQLKVAIGQGISQARFEVGEEVKTIFREAGFPKTIIVGHTIDLIAANEFVLKEFGVLSQHIWAMRRCTFEPDFFSYRRDKGLTGRMWGAIQMEGAIELR